MSAFIDDGYTIDSVIPAVKGIHEDVRFSFRPATAREYRKWLEDRNRDKSAAEDDGPTADSKYVAAHLVKWDIKSSKNGPVQITPENCDRLHPNVQAAFINQISGDTPPGVRVESEKGN